jgi:hypothetical protein
VPSRTWPPGGSTMASRRRRASRHRRARDLWRDGPASGRRQTILAQGVRAPGRRRGSPDDDEAVSLHEAVDVFAELALEH